jgi:hypothetical protein
LFASTTTITPPDLKDHAAGGWLDSTGRAILSTLDYRVVALTILLAVALFVLWRRIRHGQFPSLEDCFRVGEACGLIVTGILVACVFLMTSPPAVEELSHENCAWIGLVTFALTIYFGGRTIRDSLSPPPK